MTEADETSKRRRSTVRAELDRVEERPPGMEAVLYRRYDADGALLYVGVSKWPKDRASGHGHHSIWAQFAATGTNQWFAARLDAARAEKSAIYTERPLFNRHHSAPGARERLNAYLTDIGRTDLLAVVADWQWDFASRRRRDTPEALQK